MYNNSSILSCTRGLIGFEQSYNSDHDVIDSDLVASTSGLMVGNGLHPLLTTENILAIAEQFSRIVVRVWTVNNTYRINDIVKEGQDIYQSIVDANVGFTPSIYPARWRKTNLLSAYLRKMYDASVLKLLSQFTTEKKLNELSKTILSNVSLYEGVGNISGRITKQNRIVGYKIRLKNPDTVALLTYLGMQLDTVQADFKIYLFHSSSPDPVATFTLNHTKSIQFQWHKIPLEKLAILNNATDGSISGGTYYLVYYESDTDGSAIEKQMSFDGKYSCGTCTDAVVNGHLFNKWNNFISIQPFYIAEANVPATPLKLWEETDEILVSDTNWGMNLQISVQCDLTNVLCQASPVMADALSKQLTVDLLQEMAYSLRDNQKKEKIASLAATALDNQENGQHGEVKKLNDARKALSFDLSNISSVCLPCHSANGTKLKSVWS